MMMFWILLLACAQHHPAHRDSPSTVSLVRDCYVYDPYGNRLSEALPAGARVYLNTGNTGPQWAGVTEPSTGKSGYVQTVCLESHAYSRWDIDAYPRIRL